MWQGVKRGNKGFNGSKEKVVFMSNTILEYIVTFLKGDMTLNNATLEKYYTHH